MVQGLRFIGFKVFSVQGLGRKPPDFVRSTVMELGPADVTSTATQVVWVSWVDSGSARFLEGGGGGGGGRVEGSWG